MAMGFSARLRAFPFCRTASWLPERIRLGASALVLFAFCQSATAATVPGAIPGSHQVSPGGAFTYTVPISVPPGVAGIEPKLSLVYSSQGGNGVAGVGWSLAGSSAIARCGHSIVQDGANRGIQFDVSDRYCLDGQRLVAINGAYGAVGTEYRTESESYTRVVSVGGTAGNPQFFKAWTKDGRLLEYGNTTDSRFETQAGTAVIGWAVNKLRDTPGNYMAFTYTEDNANGENRLERIDYTGNTTANTNPNNSVRFTYESRLDANGMYVGAQPFRPVQRLAKIESFVGNMQVRDYRLTYASQASANDASRVVEIESCAGSGDCLRKTALEWDVANQANSIVMTKWAIPYPGTPVAVADVNGDGLGDVLLDSGRVCYSNGNGFSGCVAVNVGSPENCAGDNSCSSMSPAVGDLNGDGRADFIGLGPYSYFGYPGYGGSNVNNVQLSTGSGFVMAKWAIPYPGTPVAVADVNGDGLGDVLLDSGRICYSNGNGFSGCAAVNVASPGNCGDNICSVPPTVGDLNGDGRADFIGVGGGNNVQLSNVVQPDSVRSIETSLGSVTGVTYKPLTDASVYTKDGNAVYPYVDVQAPLYVVSSVSVSDGAGGSHVTDYTYAGAKSHRRGGGFLGFRQVAARDAQSGLRSVTTYRQDYPYHGQPLGTQTLTGGGTLISQTLITYTDQLLDTGKSPVWHRSLPTRTVESSFELTGSLISTVTTDTAYDAWANPTAIVVDAGGGYSKTTTHTYDNLVDPDRWFLGRLRRSTVTSVTP